jgi:hypothetical protein
MDARAFPSWESAFGLKPQACGERARRPPRSDTLLKAIGTDKEVMMGHLTSSQNAPQPVSSHQPSLISLQFTTFDPGHRRMKMSNLNRLFRLTLCILTVGTLVSCATTQQQLARTKAGFDEVYKACIDAVVDVRFGVSSSDPKTGLIVAEQQEVFFGEQVKLNILVSRVGDATEVKVNYIPPPGTVGGGGTAEDYIRALKRRIPDVEIVQGK